MAAASMAFWYFPSARIRYFMVLPPWRAGQLCLAMSHPSSSIFSRSFR